MRTWDDEVYKERKIKQRVVGGKCVKCPEGREAPAVKQWLPCHPMCEKHYNETVEMVHIICHKELKNPKCHLCQVDD